MEGVTKNRNVFALINLWAQTSLFWRFQVAGWAIFVIVTFPLKCLIFGGEETAVIISAVRDGSSFMLTLALRQIYRNFWTDDIGRMIGLIVVSCALAGLLQGGFLLLLNPWVTSAAELNITRAKEFDVLYERTGLLYAWSFLYFGIRHAIEGIKRELRLALIETEKREAQLRMLRAQMNPHFLFNSLSTIRARVEKADPRLGIMVQSLADFLRFALDHSDDDLIPLGREYDAARNFLEVEKARLRDKLEFRFDIDERARAIPVPGIILQPLVANAVKYGWETCQPPLRIRVSIACLDVMTLQITVANTGEWTNPVPREKTSHLGLQNLRRRLELLYPGKHRVDLTTSSGWVTITLSLPIL